LQTCRERNQLEFRLCTEADTVADVEREEVSRTCLEAARQLADAAPAVSAHPEEYAQWRITARMLAALTAKSADAGACARQFLAEWLALRDYAGRETDEPALGQTPRFGADTDILYELLDQCE